MCFGIVILVEILLEISYYILARCLRMRENFNVFLCLRGSHVALHVLFVKYLRLYSLFYIKYLAAYDF